MRERTSWLDRPRRQPRRGAPKLPHRHHRHVPTVRRITVRRYPAYAPHSVCQPRFIPHDHHLRRERHLLSLALLPRAHRLVIIIRRDTRQHETHPEEILQTKHIPEDEYRTRHRDDVFSRADDHHRHRARLLQQLKLRHGHAERHDRAQERDAAVHE